MLRARYQQAADHQSFMSYWRRSPAAGREQDACRVRTFGACPSCQAAVRWPAANFLSQCYFFTHLLDLSSHFISLALVQSALVLGASLVCANAGAAAQATVTVKARADKIIFISLLPG